jgi:DNA repair protein RadA/Sms
MGLVPGSAVLLGGDPGIGKSTLMLQMAAKLAASGQRVLYVTSEESAGQLRLRAQRLLNGEQQKLPEQLYVLADTNLARIVEQARKLEPAAVIVDSIQMIYKGDLPAAPGSVTQLRACCLELVYFAKQTGSALMLIGHVTKQGALAGPRLLEHMVDTVLYFEGDRYHSHRVVRGIKNRFGTTLEVGLFEMTDGGLAEVPDGSGLLAKEYQTRSGSVVCPVLQGTRCLLVEVQALTATGFLGSVKRKVSGLDGSRLAMLIAVLEKRGGLRLADQDVFASAVGGMKVTEPAADLATALAIAGAHYDRQLGEGVCAVGEIGLGGELRHVQQMERRLREAARLGFGHVLCPPTNVKPPKDCKLVPVKTLGAALEQLA